MITSNIKQVINSSMRELESETEKAVKKESETLERTLKQNAISARLNKTGKGIDSINATADKNEIKIEAESYMIINHHRGQKWLDFDEEKFAESIKRNVRFK